jgi:hypothetical protein
MFFVVLVDRTARIVTGSDPLGSYFYFVLMMFKIIQVEFCTLVKLTRFQKFDECIHVFVSKL